MKIQRLLMEADLFLPLRLIFRGQVGFRSIHVVGEATALFLAQEEQRTLSLLEDQQGIKYNPEPKRRLLY